MIPVISRNDKFKTRVINIPITALLSFEELIFNINRMEQNVSKKLKNTQKCMTWIDEKVAMKRTNS